ncbi:LacI family transcriptional regulator [candidate division KSB3 bacterium]|uniref:LacI family transcriptional regulator n=1 Tax=candidate division KSB3 bacterium TaxID=2044937 RepID=A0A2G6EFN8_9BACT|nr:MAG: LacI family transcriptional regulator [candidate division KSB3 bacterium]PIE31107.1 MAG: LacI family transcriptional regulator [candidate division KSB3 bacterium]
MTKKNATIYDVARVAGVSITTVSRVLNSPYQVKAHTRKKVLHAIEGLNFVPKAEAGDRARKRFGRIGVLTPSLTNPSFVERLRGITSRLYGSGYELIVYSVENVIQLQHYIDLLTAVKRLDGLIVMALPLPERDLTRLLAKHIELVCIEIGSPLCGTITTHNVSGGRLAAEHLLERGYRRCAFLGEVLASAQQPNSCAKRLQGFHEVFYELDLDLPKDYIRFCPLEMGDISRQMEELLNLSSAPEAIFCYSDLYALSVLKFARARQLRIPDDLAVIGFDNIPAADFVELTSVDQHLEESGRLAVETVLASIERHTQALRHIELQPRIEERIST